MKKLLLLLAFTVCTTLNLFGQTVEENDSTQEIYCMIVGTGQFMSNKVSIDIDFGQKTSIWSVRETKMVDEDGKKIKFNSMIDACNYLASKGWTLVNAYPASSNLGNCYHFVFKKRVKIGDTNQSDFKTRGRQKQIDDMYSY